MRKFISRLLVIGILLMYSSESYAQRSRKKPADAEKSVLSETTFSGLKLRNIGPAFMSGRIADIAIHPENESIWYVAVGSGGVWKTVNSGTTWTPIFDSQKVYSIGSVTIDPNNYNTIWVGTGENVGGRHIGFGDGVYRSDDGGKTWKNMGLKRSEHISKIIVHPENSDIIWVAAQGPLWNKGGDRGLYKSEDGGKTWKKTLGDDEWVGVTDILIDPRNPDRLYAATWQRHRTVAAYMGGGPGSGIHRSDDGGNSWEKLSNGLPKSQMGKIGLAISPQKPDIVYAAIELDRRTGGVYRSADGGTTWEKRSDAVSGATGPHYYQELYASPHQFERLYLVDVRMQISDDGGKTFRRMKEESKHSDNHAIAFKKNDPNYLLVGTDGGLYESFDLTENWRFIDNLPLTQFYKMAVDDSAPFYNIYGGTQDNSTQGGPSRTDNVHGIQNSDWKIVLNWDGHQPATEPGNPDIMYAERQEGNISRIDLSTGEVIDIQPQPEANENFERFNWDAPILVSPHDPKRIYFASQRVWRSDNRGDSWKAISGDLTKNQERIELPIMGRTQSWDAPWDFLAMSNYNTITSLAESPKQEGLIYVGTDDGTIQVTEDGGANWRKVDVGNLPGVPATAFVNDIRADLHDANTVYVALDNHKYGDFKPYILKSTDRGRSWQSIRGNLPQTTLVWRLVQDHVKPGLLFLATEFGIYFTIDGGGKWIKLKGGVPTISFRDIQIQRRENDLIGASFGRGFFVLDDYSALREVTEAELNKEASLFSTRDAWWYIQRPDISFDEIKGDQGASHFVAPNPDFGAVFTYHLKDGLKTKKEIRQEKEKKLKNANIPFPGWDEVEAERSQGKPEIILTITDAGGKVVRRISGPVKAGFHRVAWDLRYPAPDAIAAGNLANDARGFMVAPGKYSVSLSKKVDGQVSQLAGPVSFNVVPLRKGALDGASPQEAANFWRSYEEATAKSSALNVRLNRATQNVAAMQKALERAQTNPGGLDKQLYDLNKSLQDISRELYGNTSKQQVGEKTRPTVGDRMFAIFRGVERSTYGPTATHKRSLEIINNQLNNLSTKLDAAKNSMRQVATALKNAGAPYVEVE
ncbi:glycosyl hydrolase [Leptobacterium flavescens]|uniref:Glycosyl hydrolase n=1 Tax=Leptobacterium flavescens TaxID=472055 RepID=A0A6P0UVD9_9FLAO|nr:glycosyl hydrolase [Leptobacterium flavescens]NER14366.1 glycosyl hydrolase [Leptobacterium flavescens]